MDLFVVEYWVGILSFERRHSINLLWLMLEDVGDEDILAKVLRQILCVLNLDAEEDLFVQELRRLVDQQIIVRLAFAAQITRYVSELDLTDQAILSFRGGGVDGCGRVVVEHVSQVLELEVTLADEDGLGRVPERIVLFV